RRSPKPRARPLYSTGGAEAQPGRQNASLAGLRSAVISRFGKILLAKAEVDSMRKKRRGKRTAAKRTLSDRSRSIASAQGRTCRLVKRVLDTHSPNSAEWRSLSLWWGKNCL